MSSNRCPCSLFHPVLCVLLALVTLLSGALNFTPVARTDHFSSWLPRTPWNSPLLLCSPSPSRAPLDFQWDSPDKLQTGNFQIFLLLSLCVARLTLQFSPNGKSGPRQHGTRFQEGIQGGRQPVNHPYFAASRRQIPTNVRVPQHTEVDVCLVVLCPVTRSDRLSVRSLGLSRLLGIGNKDSVGLWQLTVIEVCLVNYSEVSPWRAAFNLRGFCSLK